MKIRKISAILAILCLLTTLFPISVFAESKPEAKNVILMIGDGMGENHLKLAEENGASLFMNSAYDLRGQSETRSTLPVTDSAAGATALACGVRTTNSTLGVYAADPFALVSYPKSITEIAQEHGMKTGIVTTDSTAGATPAGFSVHVSGRKMTKDIAKQQVQSKLDLIWGAACSDLDKNAAAENGFRVITNKDEMNALTADSRSFGQFSSDMWHKQVPAGDKSPNLVEMTEKAIALLNENNENGFFLMIEGAHIDKQSHKTDEGKHYPKKVANTVEAVEVFDNAIQKAVEFARADGNTIVLVTADHETGAIKQKDGHYVFTSGSHSGANVPVFVYGSKDLIPNGEAVENRSIPLRLGKALGWEESEFTAVEDGVLNQIYEIFQKFLDAISTVFKGLSANN